MLALVVLVVLAVITVELLREVRRDRPVVPPQSHYDERPLWLRI